MDTVDELQRWRSRVLAWQVTGSVVVTVPYASGFGWLYYRAQMYPAMWMIAGTATALLILALARKHLPYRVQLHGYLVYHAITAVLSTLVVGPLGAPLAITIALIAFCLLYTDVRTTLAYTIPVALGWPMPARATPTCMGCSGFRRRCSTPGCR